MVQSLVTLSEDANRVLNVVKAKHGLRTKSQAIELVTRAYAEEILEPELRPEYVEKLKRIEKERSIRVRSFAKRYGHR
jgi:hypothetical protein